MFEKFFKQTEKRKKNFKNWMSYELRKESIMVNIRYLPKLKMFRSLSC